MDAEIARWLAFGIGICLLILSGVLHLDSSRAFQQKVRRYMWPMAAILMAPALIKLLLIAYMG